MLRASPYRFRSSLVVLLTLLIALAWADRLFADPVQITLAGNLAGADVTISYADSETSFTATGFAGQMLFQTSANSEFIGFCVDLPHDVSLGQSYLTNPYSTDSPTNGLTNGGQVAYLANTYGGQLLSNVQAAGLQIAIWSELYDNGNGFGAGVFQYTLDENTDDPNFSAIAGYATYFLNDAQGNSSVATWYDASPSGSDPDRGQSVVDFVAPAPHSLVLFLLGIGCLGITSAWRNRLVLA